MKTKRFISIYLVYTDMRKVKIKEETEIKVKGIIGFLERRVTPFGNGAKVDCPKEFMQKRVYLIICGD